MDTQELDLNVWTVFLFQYVELHEDTESFVCIN